MDDRSREETTFTAPKQDSEQPVPLGQRLFERPFLLLLLGLVVMFVFYTGWGMVEVMMLPDAPLP